MTIVTYGEDNSVGKEMLRRTLEKRRRIRWLKSGVSYMTLHKMLGPIDPRVAKKIINLAIFYGYGA